MDDDVELAELLAEVRRIDVMSSRLVTNVLAGSYTSVFRGAGLEFDSVREYVDGDDPRLVDWNVTARVGRPFVKTYVDERELTVLFLFDLSASMYGGTGAWSARQTAARICACLAFSAIRNNDKVGLIAFSEDVDRYVPPKKGAGHVLRIVRDCLALRGASIGTAIEPALTFASRVVRRRSVLFVVSDFLSDGWQDALALTARRHDLVAVHLLSPELLKAPTAGLLRVRDPETGKADVVDFSRAHVRRAYEEHAAAWRSRTVADFTRLSVDRMDVPISRAPNPDIVARPILKFFRMREARGARR